MGNKQRNLIMDDAVDVINAMQSVDALWGLVRTYAGRPSLTQEFFDQFSIHMRLVERGVRASDKWVRYMMQTDRSLAEIIEELKR